MSNPVISYIAGGSNLGNRIENLRNGIVKTCELEGTTFKNVSSVYETKPFGPVEQPDFLNLVFEVETFLPPENLLEYLKEIELNCGRVSTVKWGARVLDLDILFFGDLIFESEKLTIPHKGILERDFFQIHLLELNNDKK
ncbi:MAG: 2-amino-4-hydroxy-6-hydroxymethyldihydropteridine diphosphokinase, partial [Ignavibacteriaceae bacterium]|nr:2-amino-4-hydroxy-6-hydroxymethyldihydropteridine diphosphokinase [Ignavibacteriaceae bacterium]